MLDDKPAIWNPFPAMVDEGQLTIGRPKWQRGNVGQSQRQLFLNPHCDRIEPGS
jgi:hypothetical protein